MGQIFKGLPYLHFHNLQVYIHNNRFVYVPNDCTLEKLIRNTPDLREQTWGRELRAERL